MDANKEKHTSPKMPDGIPYIIGNEAAERLSYYGMVSILTVYLADHLELGNDTASLWVHYFGMGVYFFPLIGAIISDVFWGKYKTIITLSFVYCLGHFVLAIFEGTTEGTLVGLTLIAVGAGGIKPCVSSHVGDQFDKSNSSLIERVFSYFYLAINLGSLIGMLLCPFLLEAYGPSIAFGVPGILMVVATVVFWIGRNKYTSIEPSREALVSELKSKEGIGALISVCSIYVFLAFFWALFEQTKTTFVVQAKDGFMDKSIYFLGQSWELLPSQIQSVNPLFILILTPIFSFLIYPFLGRLFKVTTFRKIMIGFGLAAVSFLIVGWTESYLQLGISRSIGWLVLAYVVITAAEVMVSITALELSYTQSPNSLKSIVMGLFLLSISVGNGIAAFVQHNVSEEVGIAAVIQEELSTLQVKDVSLFKQNDKITLVSKEHESANGVFSIGNINTSHQTLQLIDLKTQAPFALAVENPELIKATRYKLSGSSYFYFFAGLMAAITFLFIIASRFFKTKTYVQGD